MSEPGFMFFIAKGGRVIHQGDTRIIHSRTVEAIAICGARFADWRGTGGRTDAPSCPKCRRVLAERAALVPIAAALVAEYGE